MQLRKFIFFMLLLFTSVLACSQSIDTTKPAIKIEDYLAEKKSQEELEASEKRYTTEQLYQGFRSARSRYDDEQLIFRVYKYGCNYLASLVVLFARRCDCVGATLRACVANWLFSLNWWHCRLNILNLLGLWCSMAVIVASLVVGMAALSI